MAFCVILENLSNCLSPCLTWSNIFFCTNLAVSIRFLVFLSSTLPPFFKVSKPVASNPGWKGLKGIP
jgi:hypothetical protein